LSVVALYSVCTHHPTDQNCNYRSSTCTGIELLKKPKSKKFCIGRNLNDGGMHAKTILEGKNIEGKTEISLTSINMIAN